MKLAKREKRPAEALARVFRPWRPLWRLNRLGDEIDHLFNRPLGRWLAPEPFLFGAWNPDVDIYEDRNNVVVKAELPGMKKEDFGVSLTDGILCISGERRKEEKTEGRRNFRLERYFGRFQGSISLPMPVETNKVRAEYTDGVLTITCPRSEVAKRQHNGAQVE